MRASFKPLFAPPLPPPPHQHYFFSNEPATTQIYTLSLHDALPITDIVPTLTSSPMRFDSRMFTLLPVDRKSTRLNSSHTVTSYAVFCLKKKKATCFTPS